MASSRSKTRWPKLVGELAWSGFAAQAMTDVRLNVALQIGNRVFEYIDAIEDALGELEEYQQGADNVPMMSSPRMEAELKDKVLGATSALIVAMRNEPPSRAVLDALSKGNKNA